MEFTGSDFGDFLANIWFDLWHLGDADLFSLAFRLLLLWLLFWFARMLLKSAWLGLRVQSRPRIPRLFPPAPSLNKLEAMKAADDAARELAARAEVERREKQEAKEAAAIAKLAEILKIKE